MFKMKKVLGMVALFSLAGLFAISCASSAKAPEWILTPSAVYPDSEYMTAVGVGVSRQDAESKATAEIVRVIKQRVQAETDAKEAYLKTTDGTSSVKSLSSSIMTTSDVEITGITIQEVYNVKHGNDIDYYALALIDRNKTGTYYRDKVKSMIDVINAKIREAERVPDTFGAAALYHEAAVLADENELYLDILSVVNPSMRSSVTASYNNAQAVYELERKNRAAVTVYIDVETDESDRIQAAFKSILKKYNITTTFDKDTASYILDVDVNFSKVDMGPDSPNKYARYVMDANLVETSSGNTVVSYGESGREAHLTDSEAVQRALRTLEQAIKQKFDPLLADYISGN